jgi:uncharacterized membrane protein HdeD (DUF308 family)
MLDSMARHWWMFALRGAFAILFGILIVLFPSIAITTFVLLFALYAIMNGVFAIWSVFQNESSAQRWLHIAEGVISILAGIGAFLYPGMTALIMLYIIAIWSIVTGGIQIWLAIQLRKEIEGEFWLGLSGLLSVIFGIILILFPGTGVLAVLLIISAYAVVFGVMLVMLSLKLKSLHDEKNKPLSSAA